MENPAPELEKESDVAVSRVVPVTTMLIESSVPREPLEPIVAEAGGANMEIEPPVGERTETEEESLKIPMGKLI
jgi:hypothetical protein